jgi:hypothetical protein
MKKKLFVQVPKDGVDISLLTLGAVTGIGVSLRYAFVYGTVPYYKWLSVGRLEDRGGEYRILSIKHKKDTDPKDEKTEAVDMSVINSFRFHWIKIDNHGQGSRLVTRK